MSHRLLRWRQLLAPAVLTVILLYAALLRLNALFEAFGPYQQPQWLAAAQPIVIGAAPVFSPPDWHWPHSENPYEGGDPHNYLRFAREMRHFYQAHVREPMFLVATRVSLFLTNDADVGISLTSIAFSLLTLPATYLVGCQIASPAVGLAAAAALGIDHTAVGWSIGGWRDEMFSFFVILNVWALLRMSRSGTFGDALLAGVVSAGGCLTRITSITMLPPVWLWLIATRDAAIGRRRLQQVGLTIAIMAALVAPYLINCALEFGDPLYAINYHTRFYLDREGARDQTPRTALAYTLDKFRARPIASVDTAVRGIIVYPFSNKWVGLDLFYPGLGWLLSWLAIGGLAAWLWHPLGRLLLLALGGSLVPYMLTWTIPGGTEWRFTLHAYPFYLLASFWMLDRVVRTVLAAFRAGIAESSAQLFRRKNLRVVLALTVLALGGAVWAFAVPFLMVRESLSAGEPTAIVAGERDRWLFANGWSDLVVTENVRARFATKPLATVRLPLPEARPYRLVLRMDPLSYPAAAPQKVRVLINRNLLAVFELSWNPLRVGEYEVSLPRGLVRQGLNDVTLWSEVMVPIGRAGTAFPEIARDQPVGLRLWYVLIIPGTGA